MSLPGGVLVYLFNLDTCRAALAIGMSLSVLVFALALSRMLGLGVAGFCAVIVIAYIAIAAAGMAAWHARSALAIPTFHLDRVLMIPFCTFAAVVAYMGWAGPYIEVPADAWWHIGRINDRVAELAAGDIGAVKEYLDVFNKGAEYWYTLVSVLLYWSATGLYAGLTPLALVNTLLFCVGVYGFALFVFNDTVKNRATRHWIAAASVFFFITHFGLSVFGYIRYYVYAPTILNYVLYLGAMACVLRWIDQKEGGWRYVLVAGILTVTAMMVHKQEALFVMLMGGGVLLVQSYRILSWQKKYSNNCSVARLGKREGVLWLTAVLVTVYFLLHLWIYTTVARHDPLKHDVMADIRHYVPFLKNLYVLKPTFQFYEAVTVWGVLVYGLFICRTRWFIQSPYLVAGMLIPLFTVFNPIFTDLFLRVSWPEVLWRMCYMLPLPFVGGYFLIRGVQRVGEGGGVPKKVGSLVLVILLILLLLPIHTTYFISPHSKLYTLAPVAERNDHRLWNDLLAFLDTREATEVVTDPVTGYVINGLTPHEYSGHKFYGFRAMSVNEDSYGVDDFKGKGGWLVVVNERDGRLSETGRYGRHWPEDIMKVSQQYSGAFVEYVRGEPEIFEEIWRRNRIGVYKVNL